MKPASLNRYRRKLLGVAAVPLLTPALAVLIPLDTVGWMALGAVTLLLCGFTAGAIFVLGKPLAQLDDACEKIIEGAEPKLRGDETGEFAIVLAAIGELESRRRSGEKSLRSTLAAVAAEVAKLGDGTAPAELPMTTEATAEIQSLNAGIREAATKLAAVRNRLSHTTRFLQEIPCGLIALDKTGMIRFINSSAERVTGRTSAKVNRKEFRDLLASQPSNPDPLRREVLDFPGVVAWLQRGGKGQILVDFAQAGGLVVRSELTAFQLGGAVDGTWYLLLRDVGEENRRLIEDRKWIRELTLKAVWKSTAQAGTEPIEAILASTRLLTSDVKQSTPKAAMLPRVGAIRQHAGALEAHIRMLRWLDGRLWGEQREPQLTEFKSIEPVKAAVDQLGPQLKSRNITPTISDKGGWLCGDEEWVRTALIGMLTHAGQSVQEAALGIHLRRLPANTAVAEEQVLIEVLDAGPLLTADQRADLESPFGQAEEPSYLKPNASGYLPGLILASRLARDMGGSLEFDSTPAGGLIVRLILPARTLNRVAPDNTIATADFLPVEELVMGWRLGKA